MTYIHQKGTGDNLSWRIYKSRGTQRVKNIFYFIEEAYICNFADDSSLDSMKNNLKQVKKTILKKNFLARSQKFLRAWEVFENLGTNS